MLPITAKEFNKMQDQAYEKYCQDCKNANVNPDPQNRYFPKVDVNYGYVVENRLGHTTWKKRKKDFNLP